jgi:hypothetical protein
MLLLGPLLTVASAATVTEIPTFLRGDILVSYSYDHLSGSLVERIDGSDLEVGARTVSDHGLSYGLVFGVAPGAAVFVTLPHTVSGSVYYGSYGDMVYDPATGSGTYQGTAAGTPGTYVSGNGLGGVWIGARGTPFSESFEKRNSRVTWLVEGAFRFGDPTSFWAVNDEGKRGAGPGASAFRLHNAFSTTVGNSAPYLSGTLVTTGKQTIQVANALDASAAGEVEVAPADEVDVRIGAELLAGRNPANGALFIFDLHLGIGYDSYAYVPSGFYLPKVLAASEGGAVLQAERFEPGGGLALRWRPFENLQIDLYGDVAYVLPQRVEFPYPVYTGPDTIHVVAGTNLGVRFR